MKQFLILAILWQSCGAMQQSIGVADKTADVRVATQDYWTLARQIPEAQRQLVIEILINLCKGPLTAEQYGSCAKALHERNLAWLLSLENCRSHLPAIIRCLTLLRHGCVAERSVYDVLQEKPELVKHSEVSLAGQKLTSLAGIKKLSPMLTRLDLSQNFLLTVDCLNVVAAPFNNYPLLEELRFLDCKIPAFPTHFFTGLVGLKRLFLARNLLTEMPDLSCCPALNMVNIGENPLREVKPLRGNYSSIIFAPHIFTEINPEVLRGLPRLDTLFLSGPVLSDRSKAALQQAFPQMKLIYTKKK